MSIGYSITAIIVDFKNRFVNKSKQTCNLNKTFYLPKKKVDGAGFGVGSSQVSDYDSFQPESGDQETHEDNRKHQPVAFTKIVMRYTLIYIAGLFFFFFKVSIY